MVAAIGHELNMHWCFNKARQHNRGSLNHTEKNKRKLHCHAMCDSVHDPSGNATYRHKLYLVLKLDYKKNFPRVIIVNWTGEI
jgi:hypothetical protein